jgi:hypothetical protein
MACALPPLAQLAGERSTPALAAAGWMWLSTSMFATRGVFPFARLLANTNGQLRVADRY